MSQAGYGPGVELAYTMQLRLGALAKQSICPLQLLSVALWEQSSLLTHCSCCWRPLWTEGRVLNYHVVRKILYERMIHFSHTTWGMFMCEMPWWGPSKGGGRGQARHRGKCLACLPLNTPLYRVAHADNFNGGFHSMAYGGHLYLVWIVCYDTVWRNIYVSNSTFWRSLLT